MLRKSNVSYFCKIIKSTFEVFGEYLASHFSKKMCFTKTEKKFS